MKSILKTMFEFKSLNNISFNNLFYVIYKLKCQIYCRKFKFLVKLFVFQNFKKNLNFYIKLQRTHILKLSYDQI